MREYSRQNGPYRRDTQSLRRTVYNTINGEMQKEGRTRRLKGKVIFKGDLRQKESMMRSEGKERRLQKSQEGGG